MARSNLDSQGAIASWPVDWVHFLLCEQLHRCAVSIATSWQTTEVTRREGEV